MTEEQKRTLTYAYLDLESMVDCCDDPFALAELVQHSVKTLELIKRDFKDVLDEISIGGD